MKTLSLLTCAAAITVAATTAGAASLASDSFNYADTAALQSTYKAARNLSGATGMTLDTGGLSYAGHFSPTGGAIDTTRTNAIAAFKATDATLKLADMDMAGTRTFYVSYLLQPKQAPSGWGEGGIGVSVMAANSQDGFNVGITNTVDSNGFNTYRFAVGAGRYESYEWRLDAANVAESTLAPVADQTYLLLARFDYTQPAANPWSPGTIDAKLAVYPSGEALPTTEAGVNWIVQERMTPGYPYEGPITLSQFAVFRDNTEARALLDEVRIGTEFGDVMAVPEPAALSVLSLAGLLALRRRR